MTEFYRANFGVSPQRCAFAPGRIEFIGNHTDYNDGLVMGAAVTEGITVAVGPRKDREMHLVSEQGERVVLDLDKLEPVQGAASWTNYPAGVVKILLDLGVEMPTGFDLAVTSTLPSGAGMSSSAAFELSTAYALAALYGFQSDPAGFARIGRRAENEFVGMPCGILDQGVSAFGRVNSLVSIDCATETFSTREMPSGAHFWIFNSNKKHALVDSAYGDRHRECHDALAVLRGRYPELQNLSQVDEPRLLSAKEELGDLLFRRARHIVGENARVRQVEAALRTGDLDGVGQALLASHESSRVNFENSTDELDFLVNTLSEEPHIYGARLTGGGFGGAVMALTDDAFGEGQAARVAEAYERAFGLKASILHTQAGAGARLLEAG
ncbi:MAG: galactokinase [Opitutales bacterium]